MAPTRKIFSLFFLGIFLYNVVGYYLVFAVSAYLHKSEMEAMINAGAKNQQVQVIEMNKQDLKRNNQHFEMIGDDEIRYKGFLYDIVKIEVEGDSVYFYCINDKKETRLFADLQDHVNRHMGNESLPGENGNDDTFKKIASEFVHEFEFAALSNSTNLAVVPSANNIYHSPSYDIQSPPPWRVA